MTAELIDSPPIDFGNLPDADTLPPDVAPEGPPCPVCGEPVPKLEGQKRRRKYHDACKPSGSSGTSTGAGTSPGTGTRPRGVSAKAEKEADEAIAWFKTQVIRGCLMLSVIDRYDAFVVMVNLPEVCETLKGVLLRYPKFRSEFAAIRQGGSIIGLCFLVVLIVVPIAAHHGLIPNKKVTEILVRTPFILFELAEKLKEGEAGLRDMMQQMYEQAKRGKATPAKGGEPSPNGKPDADSEYLIGTVVGAA